MEPFKEQLNLKNTQIIAQEIKNSYADFKINLFLKELAPKLASLELKQRIQLIAESLVKYLPSDLKSTSPILIKSSKNLSAFKSWPLVKVVELIGMNQIELSLDTLFALTSQFSAEFSIRSFLIQHEKETLEYLRKRIRDPSDHIRRLISEGTRPQLPWGEHIPHFLADPNITWDLLEQLKLDESEYVRKSVANHLNDHSKKHEKWLLQKLKIWKKNKNDKIDWIIKHGLRTLIKKGDKTALKLIGIKHSSAKIISLRLSKPQIKLGEVLTATYKIKNLTDKKQQIIIDQKIQLLRANNKYGEKVFKGKRIYLAANESITGSLNLILKAVTTRSYYPGLQFYSLLVNGKDSKKISFKLKIIS